MGEVDEVDRTMYVDSLLDGNTYHTYRIAVHTEWGVKAFSNGYGGTHNEWIDGYTEWFTEYLRAIDLALDEEDNLYFAVVVHAGSYEGLAVYLMGRVDEAVRMTAAEMRDQWTVYIAGWSLGGDRFSIRPGSPICLAAGQGKVYVAGASEEGTIWVIAMDGQGEGPRVGRKLWMGQVDADGVYPVDLHLMENGVVRMVDDQGMMYRFGADGSYEVSEEKTHISLSNEGYLPLAGTAFGSRLGPAGQDAMVFAAPEGMVERLISYYWNDKGGFYKRWSPIGDIGMEDRQIIKPSAVTVDEMYRRIIALDTSGRLQIFSIDPVERGPHRYITGWGRYGEGDGQFAPARALGADVEVDSRGRIYVGDIIEGGVVRIQGFEP